MNTELSHSPSCERNRQPILDVLEKLWPERGIVLEIGSGTGQHVVFFAPLNFRLSWQPSDVAENLDGLAARIRAEGGIEPILRQSAYFRYHNRCDDVGGLFFVGANTHPGAGMPGVLCSAKVLESVLPAPSHPLPLPTGPTLHKAG